MLSGAKHLDGCPKDPSLALRVTVGHAETYDIAGVMIGKEMTLKLEPR
jgi:hypothetical protein